MTHNEPEILTELHAGPPPANPPLFLAVIIVSISIGAPWLFARAGAPSLLLGVAALALGIAGVIAVFSAALAYQKRQADRAIRLRASISPTGISFYRKPSPSSAEFFPREQVKKAWLLNAALILETSPDHPKPGRHRLAFSQLASPKTAVVAAIDEFNTSQDGIS